MAFCCSAFGLTWAFWKPADASSMRFLDLTLRWAMAVIACLAGQAEALLQITPSGGASVLLGNKGYGSDAFVEAIRQRVMQAVILPRSNRVAPRDCDWFVHKERT